MKNKIVQHGNVELISNACAENKLQKFQAFFDINLQKHLQASLSNGRQVEVKTHFNNNNHTEHMWVNVFEIDLTNKYLIGRLANVPTHVTNINCGDVVLVKFKDISDACVKNKSNENHRQFTVKYFHNSSIIDFRNGYLI